jgi:hypothetical protein
MMGATSSAISLIWAPILRDTTSPSSVVLMEVRNPFKLGFSQTNQLLLLLFIIIGIKYPNEIWVAKKSTRKIFIRNKKSAMQWNDRKNNFCLLPPSTKISRRDILLFPNSQHFSCIALLFFSSHKRA